MKTQDAIFSFSAGVLTPRISARADSPKFTSALLECENWIISPQGGAIFREGFEHIEETNQNRLFQFHQGGNESDIIVEILPTSTYGTGIIHFHTDLSIAPIASLTDIHSYNSTDLKDLYFTNQENLAVIVSAKHPPLYMNYLNDGTFTANPLAANLIPEFDYRDEDSPASSTTNSADYNIEFVDGVDTQWQPSRKWMLSYDGVTAVGDWEYSSTSATLINRLEKALAKIPSLSSDGTTFSVVADGTPDSTTKYIITILGVNGGKNLEIFPKNTSADRYVQIENSLEDMAVLEPAWSFPTYVFHTANYYQCIATHTSETGVNEPPDAAFWIDLGVTKPDTFDWQYPDGNVWVTGMNYAKGDREFPTVDVFHEQRLILAASKFNSTGLWGSRIGEYRDFIGGVNAADPFVFTLDTSDTPTIKWMISQLDLIVGTSAGDWAISAEVSLGPGDIAAAKQNYARSYHTHPVAINTNVFYVEQGQTKMRMTQYQRQKLGFVSSDISIMAEHLLHAGIKRIVVLRTPEVLLVALRDDGVLLALTYAPEQEVGAWVELKSQGWVSDISAYYSTVTNQDELWVIIAYGYDPQGPNQFYLEKMPYPSRVMTPYLVPSDDTLTEQGVVCMDSWIEGTAVDNVITGLEHLEGRLVAALVDDAWTGTYTVNGGRIVLDDTNISGSEPYNGISAVGLLYIGQIKTFEVVSGNQTGTGLGTTRRWSKLIIRLLNSALPIVNGTLPPDRTPATVMDIAETLRMGLRDEEIRGAGWGDGSIEIVQDRPYPTQVVGLFGDFQLGSD
jgi:hypothetical protein